MNETSLDRPQRSAASRPLLAALLACAAGSLGSGDGSGALESDSRSRTLTDRRVERLGRAVVRYYEDVRAWPSQLRDLVVRPAGASRWAGSYVPIRFADFDDPRDGSVRDGWNRRILLTPSGFDAFVLSRGADGLDEAGAGDDRGRWVNADQALWKETKREVRVLNVMLRSWLEKYPSANPPNSFEGLYGHLRSDGFLPSTAPSWKRDYWADGWGSKYKVEKKGQTRTIYSSGRP